MKYIATIIFKNLAVKKRAFDSYDMAIRWIDLNAIGAIEESYVSAEKDGKELYRYNDPLMFRHERIAIDE